MSPLTNSSFNKSRSPSQPTNVDVVTDLGNFAAFNADADVSGIASTLPQMGKSSIDPFGDLFSPSILKTFKQGQQAQDGGYFNSASETNKNAQHVHTSYSSSNGGDSTAGIPDHRVFRFNSNSVASNSASPSTSSVGQWNHNATNSSCGTSPEPAGDSPATNTKSPHNTVMQQSSTTTHNSVMQQSTGKTGTGNIAEVANFANDGFTVPQLDTFDPVLFGDYRDSTENIVGGGDFTGGFFDDSLNSAPFDFGSPSNLFGILTNSTSVSNSNSTAPAPSQSLMAEIEKARDGGEDDDHALSLANTKPLPTVKKDERNPVTGKLISCTNIW